MQISPDQNVLWEWHGLALNATTVFTWGVMAIMVIAARLITLRLSDTEEMSRWQNLLEVLVVGMRDQIGDVSQQALASALPRPAHR